MLQEILLKIRGDSSGGVKAFQDTTRAAQQTEKQTEKVEQSVNKLAKSMQGVSSAVRGFGLVEIFSSVRGYISDAADALNMLFDIQGKTARGEEAIAGAASPSELAGGLVQTAKAKAGKFTVGRMLANLVGDFDQARREEELLALLMAEDPQAALAAIPSLPSEFAETGAKARQQILARQRGVAYRSGLRTTATQQGTTTIVNQYPVGTNPASVDKAQSRYERVNGRPRRP